MKKILSYLLIFVIGLGLGFGLPQLIDWYLTENQSPLPAPTQSSQKSENKFILSQKVGASLVWWDQDNGLATLKKNKDKISSLNPVWYKVKIDGSIEKFSGAENKEIIDFAKDNHIQIIPAITNDCEPYESEEVLKNNSLIEKHLKDILQIVETKNYDGIEINYECLSGGSSIRSQYSDFLSQLSDKLHAQKKILTTSVHAKNSDAGIWEGAAAQDWKVLGQKCDQVKIMTYDFHWSTSEAGDIAPLSWMEETLSYAVKVIDLNKIYLGIHFYGYDWKEKQAKDLTYNNVLDLVKRFQPQIATSKELEKYFKYTDNDESHTVYYADHETISKRIELVKKYKIAGIGIWRLGQEDPENWTTINNILK